MQLDQVLAALQANDRENLQKLLQGYGTALNHRPTAAEDRTQDPDVRGETAGESINDSFQYGATAARDSAIVAEALLGTEPNDLSNLIAAQADLFGALSGHEQELQGLVTNFNTTVGAFAAESDDLARSVKLLAPTLERATPSLLHTDQSLPFLRRFARELEPSLRELPATIAVSRAVADAGEQAPQPRMSSGTSPTSSAGWRRVRRSPRPAARGCSTSSS